MNAEDDASGHSLTTYLAAGSAMLMKTAASRSQNLPLFKNRGAAGKGVNPLAGTALAPRVLCTGHERPAVPFQAWMRQEAWLADMLACRVQDNVMRDLAVHGNATQYLAFVEHLL